MRNLLILLLAIALFIFVASIVLPAANLFFLPQDQQYMRQLTREQITRERMFTDFMGWAYKIIIAGLISVIVLIIGGLAGAGILAYRKRRDRDARQEDGSYPLQRRHVNVWSDKLKKMVKTETIADMNQIVGNSMTWHPDIGQWVESHGGAGWDRQLIVARDAQLSRRTQAAVTGDQAYATASRNFADAGSRVSITNKPPPPGFFQSLTPPRYNERQMLPVTNQEPEPEPEPTPIAAPSFKEAWAMSKPNAWVLGYSTAKQTAGSLATFNPITDCNIGIIGAPGTGKTTAAYHVIALALRYGYQVAILDGKGGADLAVFKDYADYQTADGMSIQRQIAGLHEEFKRRQQLLRTHNASDITELQRQGIAVPRILVVMEEFGQILDELPATTRGATIASLQQLLLQSRYTGLHFACIDHRPKQWPDALLNALKYKIVFHSDARQAGAVQEWDAPHLKPVGEFVRYRTTYQAWNARGIITKNLAKIAKLQSAPPIALAQPAPLMPSSAVPSQHPEVAAGFANIMTEISQTDPERHTQLLADWFAADPARWQRELVTKTGQGTRDIARAMARWDNEHYGANRTENDMVGAANKQLIEWRLRGGPPGTPTSEGQTHLIDAWQTAGGQPIAINGSPLIDPRDK